MSVVFTPELLRLLRTEVNSALAAVGKSHGVAFELGSCTYDSRSATFKLKAVVGSSVKAVTEDRARADFIKYAEACKAFAVHVEKLEDFDGAFQKALTCGKAALIDVVVESEVYPPFGLGKV